MKTAQRHQDPRQPQGRVRRRIAGEPPLPLFREQGRRRRPERRRGAVPLDRRRRDRPRARPPRLPRAGRRSGDRPADRQLAPEPEGRGRRRDARVHRHVPGHGEVGARRRLRRDRRLVRDAGEGRALARQPLPEGARRAGRLSAFARLSVATNATLRRAGQRVAGHATRRRSCSECAVTQPRSCAICDPSFLVPAHPMTMREGSLEAPTRHPLDWKNPEFYERRSLARDGARLRHLPRLPALREPVQRVPDALRPASTRARPVEVDGVAKEKFWEGRRPVLPVRPLLHGEVPVRSAASVERRLPAPDAARQGRTSSRAATMTPVRDRILSSHRPQRQARDDSGRGADGERGAKTKPLRAIGEKVAGRAPGRVAARRIARARSAPRRKPSPSMARCRTASARRARSRSSRPAT